MTPTTPPPQFSWWTRHQRQVAPWLFLLPGMVMFAVYVIAPIFQSIAISFYDWDGLGEATWIGLGNYLELASDPDFRTALANNLIWLVGFLLAVPAGLGLALLLNQTVFGIRAVKSLFFFPFVISQGVIGLIFTWFYLPISGLFPQLMAALGVPDVAVLSDERWVTYGIVAAGLYPQIAYTMILYLTGLNNVRPDLIEAARLEGARGWSMLWHVVLPQLRPATFIAVVVTVIGSLRSFDMVSIMTSGGPYGSSRVLAYYMYEQALSEYGYRMGYGTAIATVLFAIMLVYIVFVLSRIYRQEKES
jgi:multiple sugar transport system permease protein